MARIARKKAQSGIYHIMVRGIDGKEIFKENEDYKKFIKILNKYRDICGYELYTYCLMSNHVHLLLKEGEETTGNIMRRIGSSYVLWFNKKYDRIGYLFQGRYKSEPVEDDRYFLIVLRYILQNPVRAGIVNNIQDYIWSNYQDIIRGKDENCIDFIFEYFKSVKGNKKTKFDEFINMKVSEKYLEIEKRKLSDNEAIKIINIHCKIDDPRKIQNIDLCQRNVYLKDLKETYGLSIRQIERLTGLGRGVIQRV